MGTAFAEGRATSPGINHWSTPTDTRSGTENRPESSPGKGSDGNVSEPSLPCLLKLLRPRIAPGHKKNGSYSNRIKSDSQQDSFKYGLRNLVDISGVRTRHPPICLLCGKEP